ncbi:MAG: hypothetical protein WA089_10530 [Anaerolineae bacterium]
MRKALGDFRREATRYGGLLNLLAARFASQRLTRHPNVSWSKARCRPTPWWPAYRSVSCAVTSNGEHEVNL